MSLADEVADIPVRAAEALSEHRKLTLPTCVPYVGMGSSYYAPLTYRYCGVDIEPQIASEYFGYLSGGTRPSGVLLSQSGESSETLWCRDLFDSYVAVVNNANSALGLDDKVTQIVDLFAGDEQCSSTKTYVNTLVALSTGFGIDPTHAVDKLHSDFAAFETGAAEQADRVLDQLDVHPSAATYVVGSGPNVGTAHQGALILSETMKRAWVGMPIAQYDHGPKETAPNSVVIMLDARGRDSRRTAAIRGMLAERSNAVVIDLIEDELDEKLSPITLVTRISFLMSAIADRMGIADADPFAVGGKVTTVSDDARPD